MHVIPIKLKLIKLNNYLNVDISDITWSVYLRPVKMISF